jgi:hypothetical protein
LTGKLDLCAILARYSAGLNVSQLREQAAALGFHLTVSQMAGRLASLRHAGRVECNRSVWTLTERDAERAELLEG